MLITSKQTWGPYTMLGAYPRPHDNVGRYMEEQNRLPEGMPLCIDERLAYFSRASLEKVVSTRVFVSDTATFLGAIFKYENGTEQAVGECRVDLAEETVCDRPMYACITAPLPWGSICDCKHRQYITRVRFVQRRCERGRGCCHPMVGEMRFWLTDISNIVVLFRPEGIAPPAGLRVSFSMPSLGAEPGLPVIREGGAAYGPIWVPGEAAITGLALTTEGFIGDTEIPVRGHVEGKVMKAHAGAVAYVLAGREFAQGRMHPLATALVNGKPPGRYHVHDEMTGQPAPTAAERHEAALARRDTVRESMRHQLGHLVASGAITFYQADVMAHGWAGIQVPLPLNQVYRYDPGFHCPHMHPLMIYYAHLLAGQILPGSVNLIPPQLANHIPQLVYQTPPQPVNQLPPQPAPVGPSGSEAAGPSGPEASGPSGSEAAGPSGSEAAGPSGSATAGPSGSATAAPQKRKRPLEHDGVPEY